MPIRAVTFDLWQTLLMDNPELGRARMKLRLDGALEALRSVGEDFTEEHVLEAYRQCYRTCHDIRARELDVSFMEQIEIFLRHIDQSLLDRLEPAVVERIATVYADSLFPYPPPLHSEALALLRRVKERGYRLGLISNTGMTPGFTFRAYLNQISILSYFDTLTFSDEVRLAKPSREIFLKTARALGVPPQEVVHVGDHLMNDVLGAQRVGMKTIWIETHNDQRPQVDAGPDASVPSLGPVAEAIESLALTHP